MINFVNPEDSDGSSRGGMLGVAVGATIRLLHGPAIVVVDRRNAFARSSASVGIKQGDLVYINNAGYVTTAKPNDSAPIMGIVLSVNNHNVELDIEPRVAIAYNRVISHSGGIITEGEFYDPKKTIAYSEEDKSEELKTAKDVALERKDGMRKGGATRTTMEEDFLSVLLED